MKKRILGILMALVMVMGLMPATAFAAVTPELDANGTLTISGYGVISSEDISSYNKSDITAVVIGEGVTSIGNYGFYGCSSLEAVQIPASVMTIGNYAFSGCTSLTTVRYEGTTAPSAGRDAFSGTAVNEVSVPAEYTGGTFAGLSVQKPTVSVTGVTLDKTTAELTVGETATLTATVVPEDATNRNVTWSSSEASVATVDTNGTVAAVGEGTAIITVTTEDGGKTAICEVTVTAAPTVFVGGVGVTSQNAADVCGDGTVSYDADTKTLTLNGYACNGENGCAIYANGDLNLMLEGTNSLSNINGYGVEVYDGNLTISGTGSLEITNTEAGIYAKDGGVTISDGTVIITKVENGISAKAGVTISGGTVTITEAETYGILGNGSVTISGDETEVSVRVSEPHGDGVYHAIYSYTGLTVEADMAVTMSDDGTSDGKGIYAKEVIIKAANMDTPEPVPVQKKTKKYDVDVDKNDMENGSVAISGSRVKKGATVTITVTPDEGYELDELVVLDDEGNEIELTGKGNGKFTFKMPRGDVEVEASFREIEEDVPAVEEKKDINLTIGSKVVLVDGDPVVNDVAPIIKDSRTFLPIRIIAEELGATVTWNEAEQSVTIGKGNTEIVIYIGQAFALVNGGPVSLDAPAFIQDDRTYLPVRFVAENLGADVVWDATAQTVTITAGI